MKPALTTCLLVILLTATAAPLASAEHSQAHATGAALNQYGQQATTYVAAAEAFAGATGSLASAAAQTTIDYATWTVEFQGAAAEFWVGYAVSLVIEVIDALGIEIDADALLQIVEREAGTLLESRCSPPTVGPFICANT